MWQEISSAFLTNLTPTFLLILFAGTVVGAIIGALPGLSSISAIALMLPFTFSLDPAAGLVLLAAVYMSSEFGASIPAILMNTPGGSGAIMTMIDGYPMTKKGEAQEALYLQLFAGTFGGLLGALVLLFFTPFLAKASLLLGPPEYFWLAVAGLTLIAAVTARNIIGGLIAVVIGILLTLPGQDDMTAQLRFTFGSPDLVGGLPQVPLMLGLFAIASVLVLLEQKEERLAPLEKRPGVIRYVLRRMMKMKLVLAWTSFVGCVVGIIPGIGANTAAVAAYAEAKRISKNRDEFGTGAWEGVAAPEAANNSIIGGSLVPLLGLGIPGSPAAAIMMGALTVHGILAGPRLFTERADIAYTFMIGLVFTCFAMLIFGLLTVRYLAMVVRFPVRYVIPTVLALTMIGTFGLRNNIFDVIVLVFAGALGFVLDKIGITWVPLTLGLVLGTLIEQSYQQSVLIAGAHHESLISYWGSRPLTVVIAAAVLLMLASSVRSMIKAGTGVAPRVRADVIAADVAADVAGVDLEPEPQKLNDEKRWISLRTASIALSVALLAMSVFIFFDMQDWRDRARDMPTLLIVLLSALAVVLLVLNLVPKTGKARGDVYPFTGVDWKLWIPLMAGLIVTAFIADNVGFYESLLVYTFGAAFLLSRRDPTAKRVVLNSAVFAAVLTVVLYVTFDVLLRIPTPPGLIL